MHAHHAARYVAHGGGDAGVNVGQRKVQQVQNWLDAPLDVLNDDETISLQDLEELETPTDFVTAGFAEETAVDTFINMNGDTRYVTSI